MKVRIFLSAFAFAACVLQPAFAQEKQWTKVKLATEGAFAPWNFTEPDGKLNGFEIDLHKYLCAKMKVECELIAQSFDGMIPALNAGKFDAIMSGMSATAKREEAIAFSISYGTTGQSFATLKGSPLADLPEQANVYSLTTNEAGAVKALEALKPKLQGKIIGVQGSTIAAAFLDKYLKGVVTVREYKTTEQHDLDLLAGRVDAVIASMAYLTTASKKQGNEAMVIVGPRFQGGLLGRGSAIGLRKSDTELKAKFDEAITSALNDGTIKQLSEKWFGFDVTPR
ncbi:transporter substrate-binding domain-containing protein [Terrarubrum flagellatum]|uniref:transporter substrate-binding domain-containing protein n=1 Tax=Terrirubrum flagellatum TaxID=2895980 RepID=UPI0031452C6E